jgi:hypothetical protein
MTRAKMHSILRACRADAYRFFCNDTFRGNCNDGACCFGNDNFRGTCNACGCAYILRDGAGFLRFVSQSCILLFQQGLRRFHQRQSIQTRPQQCWKTAVLD